MKRAALYLRSSKDRKDVSIQDQRRELTELAASRGLVVVAEYSDAVESGKDWDRPGFQNLIRAIRARDRGWDAILVKDTSRVARRRNLALIFEEQECAPNEVEVVYANVPDGDAATIMILRTLLQAMDEWHSLTSRDKGLAGMAENVRQGYRAAGNAPLGYQLKAVDIGIVREGAAITKSVLEPTADARKIGHYMKLRAAQVARTAAAAQAGLDLSPSTLIGMEWNALTYAGATTFGVHNERVSTGGYKGKRKRRARSEWLINHGTHPALITVEEAEVILRQLETSDRGLKVSLGKAGAGRYLLSGVLVTPDGTLWTGQEGKYYRAPRPDQARGRYIPTETIDHAVVAQLAADLKSEEYAGRLLDQLQGPSAQDTQQLKQIHARIASLAVQIDKAAGLALQLEDPAPAIRKIDALERERKDLVRQHAEMQADREMADAVGRISLKQMVEILGGLAESIETAPADRLKAALRGFVDRIVLDPVSLECRVDYRVSATNRAPMVLLPGFEPGFKP